MSGFQSFFKYLKNDILILIQFSAVIIQLSSIFLINPEEFNLYENQNSFAAGSFEKFIAIIISIALLYLSSIFRDRKHVKVWSTMFVITTVAFCLSFFYYNSMIDDKTLTLSSPKNDVHLRIIKGDTYLPQVQECIDEHFKEKQIQLNDFEVLQTCCDIQSSADIDKVWPKSEIIANRNSLFRAYLLSFIFGISSIVIGIQTVKCLAKRRPS